MICAGVDAGSRAIKVVLVDGDRRVLAAGAADQGVEQEALARRLYDRLLAGQGLRAGDVAAVVATGYGRRRIGFAGRTVTEITCHARGVHHVCPGARTVIEIGGQDSKLLRLDGGGRVRDFDMNDRCAGGTGRFLEMVAGRFEVPVEALGAMAAESAAPATISSTCVVFAETEIVGLLAAGARPADLVAGVQRAVASRVAAMAGRDVEAPVVFTGGVAALPGMRRALAEALGIEVTVPRAPQMTGALGAALLAAQGDG